MFILLFCSSPSTLHISCCKRGCIDALFSWFSPVRGFFLLLQVPPQSDSIYYLFYDNCHYYIRPFRRWRRRNSPRTRWSSRVIDGLTDKWTVREVAPLVELQEIASYLWVPERSVTINVIIGRKSRLIKIMEEFGLFGRKVAEQLLSNCQNRLQSWFIVLFLLSKPLQQKWV